MEEENNIEEKIGNESEEIYSKKTILAFSIFFTSLIGGILMMQNLKDLGKLKEANKVLKTTIIITIVTIILIAIYPENQNPIALLSNIIGGMIFSQFYFKLYDLDEDNFKKKKIWKPLLISVCLICIITMVVYNNLI